MSLAVLALLLAPRGQARADENRSWLVELELAGPCQALRLECGADGLTRVEGPFLAGEERTLEVAVPVRCAEGASGLAALPLPQAMLEPPESEGRVRVRGWATRQPGAELEPAPSLRTGIPPVRTAPARAGRPELVIVLAAGLLLLLVRRRVVLALLAALAFGGLAFALARGRTGQAREEVVIAWQAGAALALEQRFAAERVAPVGARLEVSPAGQPLELRLARDARTGEAGARGAVLCTTSAVPVPALAPARNDWQPLAEVWTRSAGGDWRTHERWEPGVPLGAAGPPGLPPGWLTGALAPGPTVLVARTAGGTWLRCVGFEPGAPR